MADLAKVATLSLKLLDGVTGPAGRAKAALASFKNTADGLGRSTNGLNAAAGHLQRAAEAHAKTFQKLKGQLGTTILAGGAFLAAISKPLAEAKEFETVLVNIAQKSGESLKSVQGLGKELIQLSKTTNQGPQSLATAFDALIGKSMPADIAKKIMPIVAKATSAYGADINDVANMGVSMNQNLGIPPQLFGKGFDIAAAGSNYGAFELKDMAAYLPTLASTMQSLGQGGLSGLADLTAALEVARRGTGDSSSAANNIQNLLAKIQSKDVTKNFQDFGVDIRKTLADRMKAGDSPIDIIVDETRKALKGDMGKLSDLFGDMQVQAAIRPLLQFQNDYHKIREGVKGADGTVDKAYDLRMTTFQAKLDNFKNAGERLALVIGTQLAPKFGQLLEKMTPVLDAITAFVDKMNPEVVGNITLAAGGLVALAGAVTTLRIALAAAGMIGFGSAAAGARAAAGSGAASAAGTGAGLLGWTGLGGLAAWSMSLNPDAQRVVPRTPLYERFFPFALGGADGMVDPQIEGRRRSAGALPSRSFIDLLRSVFGNPEAVGGGGSQLPVTGGRPLYRVGKDGQFHATGIDQSKRSLDDFRATAEAVNDQVIAPRMDLQGIEEALRMIRQLKEAAASLRVPMRAHYGLQSDIGVSATSMW